jgi:O-antigen/teichoic acid export membrane protein
MKNALSKLRRGNEIAGATLFVISSFLQRGLSLITTPLYTRLLTTYDYGLVSTYNTWSGVLSVIFTLSIAANAFNTGLVKHKEDRDRYVSSMLGVTASTVLLGFLLVTLFQEQATAISGLSYPYFVILFINLFCNVVYGFWGLCSKFDGKYVRVVVANLGLSVVSIAVTVLGLTYIDYDPVLVKLVAGSATSVVFALILTFQYIKKSPAVFVWKYWKAVLLFCIPLIPHYMANHLLNQSDRIMITSMCGADKTAIYTIANKMPEILNIFWSCASAVYVPWLYKKLDADQHTEVRKTNTILIGAISVVAMGVIMLAPEITYVLAPEEYQEGTYLVPALVIGYSGSFISLICSHIELFHGKNYFITVITVISAAINVTLNWLLIPRFGYIAAAYTTYIGYAVMMILHYFNIKRLKMTRFMDFKGALLLFAINSLLGVGMLAVYDKVVFRYMVLAVIAAAILLNYKKILGYIKQLRQA